MLSRVSEDDFFQILRRATPGVRCLSARVFRD